jgi:AraC-like DNA-binding protein
MTLIEAALAAIESLEPSEQFSYGQMAREYGCSRAALAQRYQGVSTLYATRVANPRALHPYQEQGLLHYIKCLTKQGLPPTRVIMRNFGSQIAKREL